MKKICIALTIMFCALVQNISAQETPFEGEIVYETYENYSDYLLKMANSIWFNGVHKMRMIMKDTKMHVIDETTGVHLIGDIANKSLVHFFEATKTGIDFSNNIESQLVLINRDINYSHTVGKLKEYTYADQNKKSELLGQQCSLSEGRIVRTMGGMDQTYDVKTLTADNIPAPQVFPYNLFGLEVKNLPLKWIYKYDGGHVGFGVGELSIYYEADVIEINPRAVNDDEFVIPADYNITKKSMNAFSLMKYYSGVRKQLEKMGIKGGDNSQKTSGVHYKTEGEWGF
jgi:hypothetical protein